MNTIRFSIITVCLNSGIELGRTIESVLRQDYSQWEIIVKDGMSTDGSVDSLPKDQRIRVIMQKDKGIYDAMNQAIALAKGDYLLFLNSGDYLLDEHVLSRVAKKIADSPEQREIYYGDIYNRKTGSEISSNPRINGFACFRNIPCHQTCFYARELMKKRNYEAEFKIRADYDHFLASYYQYKVRPKYLGIVVASYEGGGYSETPKNRIRSAKEHKIIVKRYMHPAQILWYRFLLLITLAPIRSRIAENPKLAAGYNRLKRVLYRHKK